MEAGGGLAGHALLGRWGAVLYFLSAARSGDLMMFCCASCGCISTVVFSLSILFGLPPPSQQLC
jgi:hypothetical protein